MQDMHDFLTEGEGQLFGWLSEEQVTVFETLYFSAKYRQILDEFGDIMPDHIKRFILMNALLEEGYELYNSNTHSQ